MSIKKNYPVDVEGTDIMSSLMMNLVNTFPGLDNTQKVLFATLDKSSQIALFPTGGTQVLSEKKSITGHIKQVCQYSFVIIYRCNPRVESERLKIKELLDALGKWLSRQPITVKGKVKQLLEYPKCKNENRTIRSVEFTQPAFLVSKFENGTEDWEISCQVNYNNEYDV